MARRTLDKAHKSKNDEFYTQYEDVEREVNAYLDYNPHIFKRRVVLCPCDDTESSSFTKYFAQNFEKLGLKKLICTSYEKTGLRGRLVTLESDENNSGRIDIEDIKLQYLEGDGDFRSEEVKKLRDEADFIITNPPFSLFREFINWILEGNKKFLILGNQNAITYKDFFPFIAQNKIWLGNLA